MYWAIVIISVVQFVPGLAQNRCKDSSWTLYNGETCIKAFDRQLSWNEAKQTCQRQHGADLVNIEDDQMNTFVTKLLVSPERYWVGNTVEGCKSPESYCKWRKGEPNLRATLENCVEIIGNKHGRWKIKPCVRPRRFICQSDAKTWKQWNDLVLTWGKLGAPNSEYFFNSMPRTTASAYNQGFKKISDCDLQANWRGSRFVENDDYAVVLLYDVNGYIAGIQTIVTQDQDPSYPSAEIQPPWVKDGDNFILSAYFVDPSIICTTGRNSTEFENQGTGTRLYIQHGNNAERDSIMIPMEEKDMVQTKWVKQTCFPLMGMHYWYDVSADMSCDRFYPVFLLYNHGQLNAFGWTMTGHYTSKRLEHPPKRILPLFFDPVPKCLYDYEGLTTLHIYMTKDVSKITC